LAISVPWFDDGNIILEAELTQFKVYRGILSANSEVFRDMFAIAQAGGNGEVEVEGCPVVHLQDKAADLRHVLEVLHDSKIRGPGSYLDKKPMPLSMVAAFLRLGRKYGIDHLREEALARLLADFPSTLRGYDDCQGIGWPRAIEMDLEKGAHITVVNLARENDVRSILPFALYFCCRYSHYRPNSSFHFEGYQSSDEGSLESLCVEDIKACSVAQRTLLRLQATKTFSWLNDLTPGDCATWLRCATAKKEFFFDQFYPSPPFMPFRSWKDSWEIEMCSECLADAHRRHDQGRTTVWDKLPSIFGLPAWDELLKE